MSVLPTVRIKSDIPGCEAGLDINEADFDPSIHVLFDAEPEGQGAPADIPADWQSRQWLANKALAEKISGDKVASKADAEAIIITELAKREAA